jgi:pimeloyl-ACP methyl ester carboxylesterase
MPWRETPAEVERARAERALLVPSPHGRLFGILTPPASGAPSAERCVVFFTRPRSHRNRMWVEGARRLATRGFTCFRFDYHGAGDSEGASAFLDPGSPYRDDAVAVLRFLREAHGQRRFVLVGSCFDARTALSAFVDEGDSIDGLAFVAAPVMELETQTRVDSDRKDWGHIVRALGNPENWQALARSERWRYMATVVSRVARRSLAGAARHNAALLSPDFVEHFEALKRSRARALFLYGDRDAEYATFQVAERTVFAALDPATRRRFEIEVWPGEVHGFLEMTRARETFTRVLEWIESLGPSASAAAPGREPARRDGRPKEATWTSS